MPPGHPRDTHHVVYGVSTPHVEELVPSMYVPSPVSDKSVSRKVVVVIMVTRKEPMTKWVNIPIKMSIDRAKAHISKLDAILTVLCDLLVFVDVVGSMNVTDKPDHLRLAMAPINTIYLCENTRQYATTYCRVIAKLITRI
jgi:hypothetical protein